MEHKRAKKRWGRFLILWALFLLIIGAIGCVVLYRYLDVYEQTCPEIVIEEFLADQTAESIVTMAQQNMDLELTEFEDASVLYEEYLSTVDTSLPLTYRSEKRLNTNDLAVYAVRSGPSDLCYVELIPTDDAPGFGRHHWTVGTVSPSVITELLNSAVVTIDALEGSTVFVNGKPGLMMNIRIFASLLTETYAIVKMIWFSEGQQKAQIFCQEIPFCLKSKLPEPCLCGWLKLLMAQAFFRAASPNTALPIHIL